MSKFTVLLLVSLCMAGALAVRAQNAPTVDAPLASCDVWIKVYAIDSLKGAAPVPLSRAQITVRRKGGKVVSPTGSEAAFFARLPKDVYEATVKLAGYKTTVQSFKPLCEYAAPPAVFAQNVFLWKGDWKQTAELPSVVRGNSEGFFGVSGGDSSAPGDASQPTVNGKVVYLARPPYPPAARAVRASGAVNVQVLIDELGTVLYARAVSGHPLLRAAAEKAALESRFSPTLLEGYPVKVMGILVYNFTAQ